MKIKYCLKIIAHDFFSGDFVREYYYKDISELNLILSKNVIPDFNFWYIKSMEIVKL